MLVLQDTRPNQLGRLCNHTTCDQALTIMVDSWRAHEWLNMGGYVSLHTERSLASSIIVAGDGQTNSNYRVCGRCGAAHDKTICEGCRQVSSTNPRHHVQVNAR